MALELIARKLFGTQNDRELKSIRPIVAQINALEPSMKALSNDQLRSKTAEFKERLKKGATLEDILPEAFAAVREGAFRAIGQRHYDVQLIGGITLHRGRIAEMRTGEGKTLVATLAAYLNALEGKGVHVITVNDYLARRDSDWMGRVYGFMGLTTGIIIHGLNDRQRQMNYAADITYGTNNEFGFDYLRDNMKFRLQDYVQREPNFAIVDEVDSILIDEARTPLIISGPSEQSTDLYYKIDQNLRQGGGIQKDTHYTLDEKEKSVALTPEGVDVMEKRLGVENLYDPQNIELLHHVIQALRAHVLFKRDVEYVVRDGEVMIVDEFTGRIMPGRRWSDGLHQAIEAKEGVTIENENQTLATITFQNYFRMYKKLSGMTGTADTEATEFKQIYKLDVTIIPTHREIRRTDQADVIYKTAPAKFKAISEQIHEIHKKGQPVLVGTVSIEKSEILSELLKQQGVRHQVLNAKQHEREAEIVAQAGRKGAVTISTNMAGRGTDILLGGNPDFLAKAEIGSLAAEATEEEKQAYEERRVKLMQEWKTRCEKEREDVVAAGGLFILGTERHESRRIDNQLRGRAGRQGDPGESRFYLSLDDDLMRIFGGQRIAKFMEDDLPIEHRWINKAIENAQKKVEGHNYDIRKRLIEYDDVMNQQRKVIYAWRKEVLSRESLREMASSMIEDVAISLSSDYFPNGKLRKNEDGSIVPFEQLKNAVQVAFQAGLDLQESEIAPYSDQGFKKAIIQHGESYYSEKEKQYGRTIMGELEKMIFLTTIDHLWKDHLLGMDHLREGVHLQGYGQKDPLIVYKKEGFQYFQMMVNQITQDVVRKLFTVQVTSEAHPMEQLEEEQERTLENIQYSRTEDGEDRAAPLPGVAEPAPTGQKLPAGVGLDVLAARQARPMQTNRGPEYDKVGRNDPCPCGSGKKFKKCHGTE